MDKKFIIAVVVMFVACMLEGFVVHGGILAPEYAKLGSLFRPQSEAEGYFGFMILGHVALAIAFVWIYVRGKEAKPFFAQGLRYGLAMSLAAPTATYLIYYAVQPLPGMLVVSQIVLDTFGYMAMGVLVAWLYREPADAT